MRLLKLLLVVIVCGAAAPANKGDYGTAFRLYRPLAEQGNVPAQYSLGIMYENGPPPSTLARAAAYPDPGHGGGDNASQDEGRAQG
jgi:TPR repeat protein